ncbi:hypothetical protein BDV12DRAFT_189971 [Aspergillus spectabilis]
MGGGHMFSCKKNKRRCDKQFPTCGSCSRTGRTCNYSNTAPLVNGSELSDLQRRVHELEQTVQALSGQPHYSSGGDAHPLYPTLSTQAYYLDPDVWSSRNLSAPSNPMFPPDEILTCLGGAADLDNIKNGYFQTIHSWMPFISKIKLDRAIQEHNGALKADTALLLHCMKLVQVGREGRDLHSLEMYTAAKRFGKDLELEGVITLRAIQSSILLLIYELGHGILPAAFMTISHCARQGVALGLHNKNAPQLLREPRSWVDWEERQRVWWAIVILDRYIALGGNNRPLCTDDPERDTLLPANDHSWNNGEMAPPDRVCLSSQTTNALGSFARLAQASNLLGRAVYSLLELLPTSDPAKNDPSSEPLNALIARAICYSALFKLADHHTCNLFEEDGQILDAAIAPRARENMQKAFHIVKDTCGKVTVLAQEAKNILTFVATRRQSRPRP